MTDEKWEDVKAIIKEKFELLDEREEGFSDERPGKIEIVEFMGPLGKMKLERSDQPVLLDKKTIGSRRIGSETKVAYVYSDTERMKKFKAFRWDEDNNHWVEMEMEKSPFIF